MYNGQSNPTITECIFTNNTANDGGGMYNTDSDPTLTDTTVCGNTPDQILDNWTDNGGNWVGYICPWGCPDIQGPDGVPDGTVDVLDLLEVISQWECEGFNCTADVSGPDDVPDGTVNVLDLIAIIAAWGACP